MTFTDHRIDADETTTAPTGPTGWYPTAGKRLIDLLVAGPLLLVVTPVLVFAILALRLKLGPGVILRQQRVGRNAEVFAMLKLRTMEHSRRHELPGSWDGQDRRATHKSSSDPRHTRLGRMLRKFSIDELPQLVNVVKGDMSLVGPRPQLATLASEAFRAHPRHLVRPGLTGPFQVSPLRSGGNLDTGLGIDSDYVEKLSFRSDLRFLLSTVKALIDGTGS